MGFLFRRPKRDDKAAGDEAYARGQWGPALEAYERALGREGDSPKFLQRVGELRAKLGRRADAAEAYRQAADAYAGSGFLVQAIAMQKILLRLDPGAREVGERLADLYAQRGLPAQGGSERRALPEIPLFSDLDREAFRQVVDRLVPRSLALGEVLFREGDPGDSIFVVAAGVVRVTRGALVLGELAEGTFFGEGAYFSRRPRNADVTAVTPAELLELRRQDLEAVIAQHPSVANALAVFYRRRVLDGVLVASPAFGALPEGERKALAERFRLTPVRAGEVIVREGDGGRALYLVKQGRFAVDMGGPAGGVRLGELGPGAFFGEVALLAGTPRTATVTALEEGELLAAEAADLEPLLRRYPEVRAALERARDERAAAAVAKILGRRP